MASTDQIKKLLGDLSFPAAKERIVEHARAGGADTDALKALSALPPVDYDNVAEVVRSAPTTEPEEAELTEAERDYQRRYHRKSGLAEGARPAEPPPVEEELREDPGYREHGERRTKPEGVPTARDAGPRTSVSEEHGRHPPYSDWSRDDLLARARDLGIKGSSSMSRSELIETLRGRM